MSVPVLEQVVAGRAPEVFPLTVEHFHRMLQTGILGEGDPVELIDGILVRKDRAPNGGNPKSHGPAHAFSVARLQRLNARVEPFGCHARSQLPVTLGTIHEPEPDWAVVRGRADDFRSRHPGPQDLVRVVEVADSSLTFDRTTKQRIYATAGIGLYWIVNIPEAQVEVYSEPIASEGRYAQRVDYRPDQTVKLPIDDSHFLEVAVTDLLR